VSEKEVSGDDVPAEEVPSVVTVGKRYPTKSLTACYLRKLTRAKCNGIEMGMAEDGYVARGLTDWEAAALIRDPVVDRAACRKTVRAQMEKEDRGAYFPPDMITVEAVSTCRKLVQEKHGLLTVTGSRNGRDVHALRFAPDVDFSADAPAENPS
jgi:uncharacterized Fe-S cluster-containing protein